MKRSLILAAALFAAGAAIADEMVFKQGGLQVRLHDRPCASADMAGILQGAGGEAPARAASITAGGQQFQGCWSLDSDRDVLLVDQHGRGGYLPMAGFRRVPDA